MVAKSVIARGLVTLILYSFLMVLVFFSFTFASYIGESLTASDAAPYKGVIKIVLATVLIATSIFVMGNIRRIVLKRF